MAQINAARTRRISRALLNVVLLLACLLPINANAQDGGGEAAAGGFVEMKPALITNYGIARQGRLRYVRAEVTLRVEEGGSAARVEYHLPYLRNALLMVLSKQEEAVLVTPEGRDHLRQEALASMREFLEKEEGTPQVSDILFTNFLVQR